MKLGIVGNGFIVKTFLEMTKEIENLEIVSICVREKSLELGRELAEKYGIQRVYTSYEKFLEDKIDTVYIGIINNLHYEYAKIAIAKHKHIWCEKPFTRTAEQARELFELAEKNNVYLFEAITTIQTPMFKKAKEHLEKIGKVRLINATFCQYSSRYDNYLKGIIAPVFKKELFGGALVDLNIYNIHFVVSLFGKPKSVAYFPNLGENGVDISGVLVMDYGDFKAVCSASKDSASPSFATVQGEKGYLKINSTLNSCDELIVSARDYEGYFKPENNFGRMYYEIAEFIRIILEKDKNAYEKLKKQTICVMEVLETAYNSMEGDKG